MRTSYAQHPFFYTVTDDNGLPSNEVYDIEQDSFGYVWIGCDAGLFRYDGFRFEQYSNKGQNAVAISSLRFSEGGRLYCQNFFGQVFSVYNDSLHIAVDVKEKVKGHPEFAVGRGETLLLSLPEGLVAYADRDSIGKMLYPGVGSFDLETQDGNRLFYVNGQRQLVYRDWAGNGPEKKVDLPADILNGGSTFSLRAFGRKLLLAVYNPNDNVNSLAVVEGDNVLFAHKLMGHHFAERLYNFVYVAGHYWICTSNGAYLLNDRGDITAQYFKGEKISDVIVDREGSLWFSSLQNGLFVVPHLELSLLNTTNSGLGDDNVTAVRALGDSSVLFGTYRGDVFLYNFVEGTLISLPRGKGKVYRNVTCIIPKNRDDIVVARGGLSSISLKTGRERYFSATYIRDFAEAGDSLYYVSTVFISSLSTQAMLSGGRIQPRVLANVSGKRVCFESGTGTLWFTLNTGLAYRQGNDFVSFMQNGKPLFSSALFADSSGLWVGTVSDGVYNIRNRKVRTHLNAGNGLLGNNIKCFTSRGDTLYIATDVCINVRYPNGTIRYIRHANGINAKEINAMCVAGPYLVVGTLRGMFLVPVRTPFSNVIRPNIKLTSVVANGVVENGDRIELGHDNRDVVISFSSVALKSRGRFSYNYRITGFQDEWKIIDGSAGSVRLNHLPAGRYRFEVKSVNEDNMESPVAGVDFVVRPPFWQTPVFYILLAFSTAVLVAVGFIIRIRAIQRRASIREQVTSSQLTALKAQMNPHFMYNTLNSIQDLVLQKDVKSTNYYLSRYSTLMRKILDSSGSNEIDLAEEIEMLQLYLELEKLRFGKDFVFHITCDEDVDRHDTAIPSMLIQPFVENALKHGLLHKRGEKRLDVSFRRQGRDVVCTITDNGVGRKKAAEIKARSATAHKSFATQATEKRLALINANRTERVRLEIEDLFTDGAASGTKVKIYFPAA